MSRISVGILRGGTSSEYPLSIKTGAAMMKALPEDAYDTRDILIDKSGMWHLRGQPTTPARVLSQMDVVLNALHGGVGEDGTVQRIIERAGVPYTGIRSNAAGAAMNKNTAREILQRAGVKMPRAVSFSAQNDLNTADMAQFTFAQFGPPYMIKPTSEGAGAGIRYASSFLELPDAIGDVIDEYGAAIIEEYVRGHEASVGVIDAYRNEDFYVLPPSHVQREGRFTAPHHHHEGLLKHQVPSQFSHTQKLSLADVARRAHRALGMRHFSRSDIIVTPTALYLLEVNALPGLYEGASFPHMLEAVGSSVGEFLQHAISLARKGV